MAEQREQEESERKEGAQQQENKAREREAAQAIWIREQREWSVMQTQQQHRSIEHASTLDRLVDLFDR
jgi:hypothetical protein